MLPRIKTDVTNNQIGGIENIDIAKIVNKLSLSF